MLCIDHICLCLTKLADNYLVLYAPRLAFSAYGANYNNEHGTLCRRLRQVGRLQPLMAYLRETEAHGQGLEAAGL